MHKGLFKPVDILRCYGKAAISAHRKTNCLTEILLPEAEQWAQNEINLEGIGPFCWHLAQRRLKTF